MKYYEILPTHTETPRNTTRKIANLYIVFNYHFLTLQNKNPITFEQEYTNFKKCQIFRWTDGHLREEHKCIVMRIDEVSSVHSESVKGVECTTDGQRVKPIYPPSTLLCGGITSKFKSSQHIEMIVLEINLSQKQITGYLFGHKFSIIGILFVVTC